MWEYQCGVPAGITITSPLLTVRLSPSAIVTTLASLPSTNRTSVPPVTIVPLPSTI